MIGRSIVKRKYYSSKSTNNVLGSSGAQRLRERVHRAVTVIFRKRNRKLSKTTACELRRKEVVCVCCVCVCVCVCSLKV